MRTKAGLLPTLVAMLGLVPLSTAVAQEPIAADLVLKNGTVIDGTGTPGAGLTSRSGASGSLRSARSSPTPRPG